MSPRVTSLCSYISRSSGVMDSMLFTFENRVRSCSRGVSGVASFITTDEAASIKPRLLFSMKAMLPDGFPFHQLCQYSCFSNRTELNFNLYT